MPVIDCHQHFWWRARRTHSFPPQVGDRLDRDYTPDDLRPALQASGVDQTILVQSLNDYDETLEYLDLANEVDYIAGVVGWLTLTDPAACARAIEECKSRGKLIGIRHLIAYEPDADWLQQPQVIESLGLLAKAELAFEAIPVTDAQFNATLAVARQLPDLRIVLNHLGNPPVPEGGWEPWATQIARAAELRNVSVKLSAGLALAMRWKWSTDELRPYANHTIDLFSPDRVMAGSNWPVIELAASFEDCWKGLTDLLVDLSDGERQSILGGTAQRIYRL